MRVFLITFSGVEGAGKSSQARYVHEFLCSQGHKCERVEFIQLGLSTSLLRCLRSLRLVKHRPRELSSRALPQYSFPPRGAEPDQKRIGRYKGFSLRHWRRLFVWAADVAVFRVYMTWTRMRGVEVLVCDRYFFDCLARLPNTDVWPVRMLMSVIPMPDLPFVLQIDSQAAIRRRLGASVEYYDAKNGAFERLADRYPQWIRVWSTDMAETQRLIAERVGVALSHKDNN